jgi:hypothetical protein
MGDWTIIIRGHGQHHSDSPKDAEMMASGFVQELCAAGHTVFDAFVAHGGCELLDGPAPATAPPAAEG